MRGPGPAACPEYRAAPERLGASAWAPWAARGPWYRRVTRCREPAANRRVVSSRRGAWVPWAARGPSGLLKVRLAWGEPWRCLASAYPRRAHVVEPGSGQGLPSTGKWTVCERGSRETSAFWLPTKINGPYGGTEAHLNHMLMLTCSCEAKRVVAR